MNISKLHIKNLKECNKMRWEDFYYQDSFEFINEEKNIRRICNLI